MKYRVIVKNQNQHFSYERDSLQDTKLFVTNMKSEFKDNPNIKVVKVINDRGWEVYGWERWKLHSARG